MEMDLIMVKLKNCIVILLLSLPISGLCQQKKKFKVFDAILFLNKPNLSKYGFSKINVIYEDGIISTNYHEKDVKAFNRRFVDKSKILDKSRGSKNNIVPVCIDVEHWNVQDPKTKSQAIDKYVEILDTYRKIDSKNLVSVFHYGSISKDIYNSSNVVFPAYYSHSSNYNEWEAMVRNSVNAIRKMGNKPIYAFIWPQYNNVPSKHNLGFTFVDSATWRKQLELIYTLCDGAVIWTHYNDKDGNKIYFDKNMPWFKETLKFIKEKNIK
ncbi:hypothetical protein KUH03_17655 [Sphingobacterium sp. E70]|uniref:hypothetical protein n=1 Tax=Sphingobacterium sp. E70 TaxID=2853439 RepID=UPI00211BEBB7|nr:hypothetical protein [Sphingobacterium sp. E70]ULT28252.1 hypothetical protein KUH03_17655 [Sphingobacterium sp. E70]